MNKRIERENNSNDNMDLKTIREDFPILKEKVNGKQLVYFDNAATSQKPSSVIDRIYKYYKNENANIHRGVHYLSNLSTDNYESSREKIKDFINAKNSREIIYTRGTTESINLIAQSYVKTRVKKDDEILISAMEHHSNIVPWQFICKEKECKLKIIPMNEKGELIFDEFKNMINEKTSFISITHVSNALGSINNVKEIVKFAHSKGIKVLVDGAQSIPHMKIDVKDIGCDFFVFSGHKVYGPTGIGILYGKENILEEMEPYQGGGDMIRSVTFEKTIFNDLPYKFEAGTPNIAGAIGLGKAIDYVTSIGISNIVKHEKKLLDYATNRLKEFNDIRIIGESSEKSGVISFYMDSVHPHDIGTILDQEGIAIRTGHHCSQPVMDFFKVPATARISFACYNTFKEIDLFTDALKKLHEVFG